MVLETRHIIVKVIIIVILKHLVRLWSIDKQYTYLTLSSECTFVSKTSHISNGVLIEISINSEFKKSNMYYCPIHMQSLGQSLGRLMSDMHSTCVLTVLNSYTVHMSAHELWCTHVMYTWVHMSCDVHMWEKRGWVKACNKRA